MANELVEFGDDLDLYVEGLNRLTVYRRRVPGQVWRTLIIQCRAETSWRGIGAQGRLGRRYFLAGYRGKGLDFPVVLLCVPSLPTGAEYDKKASERRASQPDLRGDQFGDG